MAGHSKWKNIQHRKGAQDAKRGKIFTKIGVEITVAAKLSGGDPDSNPRLRLALAKARAANMPKDNIQRAIKKGTGADGDGTNYSEKTYEGYGANGVAVMVECLTDNVNRTVSDVRHAFSRHGGNLGTDGSVSWMFHRKGVIVYPKDGLNFDQVFELALESGAEDVKEEDGQIEITCSPDEFSSLKDQLDTLGKDPSFCEITRIPENYSQVETDKIPQLEKLINALEDNDDVQNVYHNGDLPEGD